MAAPRCRPLAIAAAAVGIAAAGGLPALLASSGQAQAPATFFYYMLFSQIQVDFLLKALRLLSPLGLLSPLEYFVWFRDRSFHCDICNVTYLSE
mgnify:CR=1 FL=1